jgi:hypothetical protein
MRESAILLLQTGQANPGHINKNGGTALLWASYKNLPDVVSELLKHDCNVNHKREDKSALKIAFNKHHDEIVLMLIKHDWSVLENEEDNFIFDVLDCYYNSLSSLTGCIRSNKLVELLNDTMLERFLDIDTLVDFKISKRKGPRECLFCMEESDHTFCFSECGHVISSHSECVNQVDTCPMCRERSTSFRCYVTV